MGSNYDYSKAENWSGTYGTGYWGGSTASGGDTPSVPNRMPDNTAFIWGGADSTVSATIALNTALEAAGIKVNGFQYSWRVKNANTTAGNLQTQVDPFKITVDIKKADGSTFASFDYSYGYSGWRVYSGSRSFSMPQPTSFFGDVIISAQAQDIENFAGHYGPEFNVAQSSFKMTYTIDPCLANPLSSYTCAGYADAYFNQQCTANPLYNSGCPGYAAAYLTQQCNSNPLYSTSCTGYTTAYYNQQCAIDPLYDKGCTGYDQAYFDKQCLADATSDPSCPDYFIAMCKADPLYNMACTGYTTAYFDQQCGLDPQYNQACAGYVDLSGNDGDFVVLDPVINDVVNVEPPTVIVTETPVVVEDTVVEETAVEEVIEEVVIVEEVVVEEPAVVDPVKAKSEKIKEIRREITQSLADKMSTAASFEVQQQIQTQLISIIGYVPNYAKYNKAKLYGGELQEEVNLKGGRIVDNAFARWFVNDPNYERLEALQYNLKGN